MICVDTAECCFHKRRQASWTGRGGRGDFERGTLLRDPGPAACIMNDEQLREDAETNVTRPTWYRECNHRTTVAYAMF